MGFTHFSQQTGTTGVYVGVKGSEVKIADASGIYGTVGIFGSDGTTSLLTGNQIFTCNLPGASTAAEAAYIVIPYAINLVAAYMDIASGTTGTGASVAIYQNDTAGTALFGSAALASAGTAGSVTTTFGTMSTATVTTLSSLAIVKASCATAFGATITIVGTKAGN